MATSTPTPPQLASGLNLWLELRDPTKMQEVLGGIAKLQQGTREKLRQQGNVHFARFLPSRGKTVMLADGTEHQLVPMAIQVITEFDGALDSYAMDFVFTIGGLFNFLLSYVKDAPPLPVENHPGEFLNFVRKNNRVPIGKDVALDVSIFSAYPQKTVLDIMGTAKDTKVDLTTPFGKIIEQDVDFSDVQVNILRGVHYPLSRHICLHVQDSTKARAFIGRIVGGDLNIPQISNAIHVSSKPDYFLNLGVTYRGLGALGMNSATLRAFDGNFPAFVQGPEHFSRAPRNGDTFSSHPDTWVLGGNNHQVDLVLSLYCLDAAELSSFAALLEANWTECELAAVFTQNADALKVDKIHFGYVDGLSQPRLAIKALYAPGSTPDNAQPLASAGSFLLGDDYTNVYGGRGSLGGLPSALATNATFAAFRLMRQDVAAFDKLLSDGVVQHGAAGVTREWLAAKLMGRWQNGTPTSLYDKVAAPVPGTTAVNDFDYAPSVAQPAVFDDDEGARCPISSHIRRMNPRSSRVAGMPHTRRVIRRGMPYGPDNAEDTVSERGLLGIFMCADLDRQFEFLLHTWANSGTSASGILGMQDPIIGAQSATGAAPVQAEFRCLAPNGVTPIILKLPRLVETRGSVYVMMPGLAGLRYIAGAATVAPGVPVKTPAPPGAIFDPTTFDPQSKAFLNDPYRTYTAIHSGRIELAYIKSMNSVWVFGADRIKEVCSQPDLYLKREDPTIGPAGILTMDRPAHTAVRRAMDPLFASAITNAKADTTRIAAILLANFGGGQVEWVRQFARPLSQKLFSSVLAVDATYIAELLGAVESSLSAHSPIGKPDSSGNFALAIKKVASWFYLRGDQAAKAPDGVFLRALATLPQRDFAANPDALREFAANAACLALAGYKPLEWLIGLVTYHLLRDDAILLKQLKAMQTVDFKSVINELVRFDTPLPMANRYASEAVQLGILKINKGDRLTLVYGAANRDPANFAAGSSPNSIDLATPLGSGFGFGHGERGCLGYALAHQVLEPVIRALMDAATEPKLAPGFAPQYGSNPYFRFLHHLELTL